MKKTTIRTKGKTPIYALMIGLFLLTSSIYAQLKSTNQKVSNDLLNLCTNKQSNKSLSVKPFKSSLETDLQPNTEHLQISNGMVLIQAIARKKAKDLEENLSKMGFIKSGIYERNITGYIPVDLILELNGIDDLVYATPVYKPINNSGIALSNGDFALKSGALRDSLGIDGKRNKIGVLSDSYNSLGNAELGIKSGDLPGPGNPFGYNSEIEILEDIEGGSDEGRAMMEIIHDISPGAEMAFHTAYLGTASFAEGILELAENGCNIITDDVAYFAEPFFQDGIIAQALDKAVKKYDVSYYSSAGNYSRSSYESGFRNSGDAVLVINPYRGYYLGYYQLHDFDPGEGVDNFQKVTFLPGDELLYSFQWDEPFASASESSPGSTSDLDIFLTLEESAQTVVIEAINNNIAADAFEILSAMNYGNDTISAYIAIGKYLNVEGKNPDPQKIKYINFGNNAIDEYNTNSPACFGHSNSSKVQSIGASAWFFTPEFGEDPPKINYFSSVGGTPILMKPDGKRFRRPKIRQNPDLVATDGGNTTFFGLMLNDGDKFPNFFGTSAAAPHAAGVFALLNQASNYESRKEFIEFSMKVSAIDMDDPFTEGFDRNYDFATGHGLLQADQAADIVMMFTTKPIEIAAACSDDPFSSRNWVIYNPNSYNVKVDWYLFGTDQKGTLVVAPGENYLSTEATWFHNLLLVSWEIAGITYFDGECSKGISCSTNKSATGDFSDQLSELLAVTEVYPNPIVDFININLYTEHAEKLNIEVLQINGSIAHSDVYKTNSGFNTIKINLNDLTSGSYILKITDHTGKVIDSRNIIRK